MPTLCTYTKSGRQVFSGTAQIIAAGVISSNQQIVSSTSETVVFTESIGADELDSTSINFRLTLYGEISSTGTGDCALTLRYGTTDILELITVGLPNEDDIQWRAVIEGRIHTTGSTGKIVATGRLNIETGTALLIVKDTAAAGVTADLTVAGSLNVTAKWDTSNADNDIIVMGGFLELYK